jgi:hypothetical protein
VQVRFLFWALWPHFGGAFFMPVTQSQRGFPLIYIFLYFPLI